MLMPYTQIIPVAAGRGLSKYRVNLMFMLYTQIIPAAAEIGISRYIELNSGKPQKNVLFLVARPLRGGGLATKKK